MNHPIATEGRARTSRRVEHPPTFERLLKERLAFHELLDRMTPVERLRAYRSGTFSLRECSIWSARFPEEAPLLNGEFEWIARSLADLD